LHLFTFGYIASTENDLNIYPNMIDESFGNIIEREINNGES